MAKETMFVVAGAAVALVLQLLVAPYLAIGPAVPNFCVAFCLAVAVAAPGRYGSVLPFVLGLAFDLAGGGPVGAMAFSLTAFSVGTAWYLDRAANDAPFMVFALLALGVLLVELAYGTFLLLFGYAAGLLDALAYRVVPCFAYDLALSALCLLVAHRFLRPPGAPLVGITQLR